MEKRKINNIGKNFSKNCIIFLLYGWKSSEIGKLSSLKVLQILEQKNILYSQIIPIDVDIKQDEHGSQ